MLPPFPSLPFPPISSPRFAGSLITHVHHPEFSTIMAQKLSHTDTEAELRAAFDVFDTDKNGTISIEELGGLMKNVGVDLTDEEVRQLVEEADKDGNGEIDCEFPLLFLLSSLFSGLSVDLGVGRGKGEGKG